ncbi:MAG: cadherin repeat domain-containing protein, partial [Reinekea sp.]|nr:cadherin repeat domain-containing protein [Reinekea sp.]
LMFKDWDKDGNIDLLVNSDANGLQAYIPSHLDHQMFTLSGETFRFQASAADADGNALQFELQSGYDAAFFTLNSETGLLASKAPLNGDTPLDENSDNQYELTITASDGTYAITRSIGIRVIP